MDKGVFVAYDDDKAYTYVFHKDAIQGTVNSFKILLTISVNKAKHVLFFSFLLNIFITAYENEQYYTSFEVEPINRKIAAV